jgi:mono/diheme cytochrome c family protein
MAFPVFRLAVAALFSVAVLGLSEPAAAQSDGDVVARGAVLFNAGGCANCHTDRKAKGPLLGGGAALKTPFGVFYGPNISSHPEFGIGRWNDAQFRRAMRDGVTPDGSHYYPAFPYASFTRLTDDDIAAIRAYILSLPPVAVKSKSHDLKFPFSIRAGLIAWKWLYLDKGPRPDDPAQTAEWNRGRYLADGLAHCGECHTPRNVLGGLDLARYMAGNVKGEGPEGEAVPNITPHMQSGIGKWTVEQLAESLKTGSLPDGDSYGSLMADVVANGTASLNDADRRAIAVYIKSLKPLAGRGRK